jgi:hypothetical protein
MRSKRELGVVTALERLGTRDLGDVSITRVIQGHIYRVLEACGGSRTVAAAVLGMHRRTLQRILANGSVTLHKSGFSRPDRQTGLGKVEGEFSMPRLSALEYRLNEVIKQAVKQTAEIVRAEIAAQVQRTIGTVGTRAPSNGASAKAAVQAKAKARTGRQRGVDETTLTRVLKIIEENPGLRSEQIYAKLPIETELARKALTKLRDTKRVRTKGEKRAMTYAAA